MLPNEDRGRVLGKVSFSHAYSTYLHSPLDFQCYACYIFKHIFRIWGREVGLAGVGWRDGEKMQTIVTE